MSDWINWTLLGLFWIAGFLFLEVRALRSYDPKRVTLSRYMATIGAKFPLSIFFVGLTVGILAAHFYWHWGCDIGIQGG